MRRTKGGMVVRSYNTTARNAPLVFDFSTWPGDVAGDPASEARHPGDFRETSLLLAPAVQRDGSGARAHATRDQGCSGAAGPRTQGEAWLRQRASKERVAEVLKRAPGVPAISDQSEPVVEPEPEGGEPGSTFEEGEGERPADGDEPGGDEPEDGEAELQFARRVIPQGGGSGRPPLSYPNGMNMTDDTAKEGGRIRSAHPRPDAENREERLHGGRGEFGCGRCGPPDGQP